MCAEDRASRALDGAQAGQAALQILDRVPIGKKVVDSDLGAVAGLRQVQDEHLFSATCDEELRQAPHCRQYLLVVFHVAVWG
jgi:hypothetical protein